MECKAIPPTQLMRQLFLIPARMLRRARCGQGWVQTGANLLYWAVTPAIAVCWLLTIAIALGAGLGSAPTLDALVRVPVLIGAFLVLWGLIVSERRITIVLLHVSITPLSFQPYPVRRLERVSTAWRDAMAWQRAGYFTVKLAASFILAPLVALCGVLGGLLLLVPVYYIIHPYAIGVGARGAPGQAPFVWRDFGGTVVLLPIGFAVVCFAVWQLNTASQEWACFAQKMLGMSDASKRVASALEDAGRAKSHAAATEQRRRMQQASLSHDLRAPLHSIQAHVDDLIESYTAARPMPLPLQSLGIVQREVARLGDALDDLLLLERIDAGHLRPVLIPVQVSPVVVEAVEVHRAQANHRRILLQVEPTTEIGRASCRERV